MVEMLESAFVDDSRTVDVSLHLGDKDNLAVLSMRPARAILLRMDGVQAGSVFAVEQLPCTIGRHATNTLRIDEDNISRFHARISHDDGGFLLQDLESRNGTFVGGQRVNQHRLKDGDGVTFGAQAAFRFNITDSMQERLLRRLYESSTRDALTGAYNRAHFDERMRAELAFATRHSTDVSLVMIDIDHFKRVNDTYGHQAGDAVLKELAARAHRTLRAEDVFARFGGEEFAVILRGTNLDGARRLAERLRLAIEQVTVDFEGKRIPVTLSAGCASLVCCTASAKSDDLIRVADRRLYQAKTTGRNRVVADG
jgi:diguanylate cyclase (GGDEF)-like protein